MIAFIRHWLGQPAVKGQDTGWTKVEQIEEKLRKLGFGPQRTANACRERLQRLCRFLLELDPEDGAVKPGKSTIRKLKKKLGTEKSLDASRRKRIQRLEDLRAVLEKLVRQDTERVRGIPESYLTRLQGWSPKATPRLQGETDGNFQKRCKCLEKSLILLRVLAADCSQPEERPLTFFRDLLADLKALEAQGSNEADRVVKARGELCQSFDDCVDDWEWAYLQVLVRLVDLRLEESSNDPQSLKKIATDLEEAIEKLEDKELLQARRQGLYGTLAGTYLRLAQVEPPLGAEERQQSLHKALSYAQHAVEMEPERVRERLKLIEVLSTLEDYEEMRAEADIALDLDSSSETLKVVGKCFWSRIVVLRDRRERSSLLREAVRFFSDALAHVESDPFDSEDPLEQVKAHGWAHFWLGRFQCESGRYDEGVSHLRTARSLGFKPLESGVYLAWAYLLAKDYNRAGETFSKVANEAKSSSRGAVPRGPGEEEEIGDLKFQIHLGQAFLWVGRNPESARSEVQEARKVLKGENKAEREAALHEVCGLAYLGEKKTKKALKELEAAVRLSPRSGAYCALASVRLTEARNGIKEEDKAVALRQAREAYRQARENDIRGLYRRELADLRLQLREMEKPVPKPAPAAASPTSISAPSPAKA